MAADELDEVIAENMQDPLFALHFRIRELHAPVAAVSGWSGETIWKCHDCGHDSPCPTIKLLEA